MVLRNGEEGTSADLWQEFALLVTMKIVSDLYEASQFILIDVDNVKSTGYEMQPTCFWDFFKL